MFPTDGHRHAIVGMTGSGKTQFALACLSHRSWKQKPWIIIDYKRDDMIAQIPGLEIIGVRSRPPKHAGVYAVQPLPIDEDAEALDKFMWHIWERGNTGVFLDEGYMLGRFNKAYRALLTQGRSKRIPCISLSQRPSWISPFILSESEFFTAFYLQTKADNDRMREWIGPVDFDSLPRFHSYHYSVPDRKRVILSPVPKLPDILSRFQPRKRLSRFV